MTRRPLILADELTQDVEDEHGMIAGETLTDHEFIEDLQLMVEELEQALIYTTYLACLVTGLDQSFFTLPDDEPPQ